MAEINLLGVSNQTHRGFQWLIILAEKIVIGLIVVAFAYYGFLWYRQNSLMTQASELKLQLDMKQQQLEADPNRQMVLTRQGQLKSFRDLASNHLLWSKALDQLPAMMLKGSSLLGFTLSSDGTGTAILVVPGYEELDKAMQVFDTPSFNTLFRNVRIKSVAKTQQEDSLFIKARVQFDIVKNKLVSVSQ
jgi:hypothetical protein